MASSARPEPTRVLLVRVPEWTLRAAQRSTKDDAPLLVMAKGRVVACCAEAAAEGVIPGLALREAQVRCPLATVVDHDEAMEAEAFDEVADLLEQLVPEVHVVRPGIAAMRARGPARFYGGERAAAEVIWGALHSHGHDAHVAIADGLFAAERAAIGERIRVIEAGGSVPFLSGLEVGELGDDALARTLRQLGLPRIGQFAALSARQVRTRFGAAALALHARVLGEADDVLTPRRREPPHASSVAFEEPLLLAEQVVARCQGSIEALMAGVSAVGGVCTEVAIMVRTSAGVSERTWRHPWQFGAADIAVRLAWQLDDIVVADDLDAGVHAVQFVLTVRPAANHAEGLFGDRPTEHLTGILTTLQGRSGPGAVLTPVLRGDRLLRDRCVLTPFGSLPPQERDARQPWPGHLAGPSPSIVLRSPRRVALTTSDGTCVVVRDGELQGEPAMLEGDGARSSVIAWAGPWPVHQRWWSEGRVEISRVQVVTADQRAWLLAERSGSWWVEARYE